MGAQATSQAALLCGCQPPHPHTPHTGVRPKLPPKLHFCVVASHHTHTHPHTPHTGVRPKLPPKLHFCVVASHHTHTHTHTHHTLVLGPSYLQSCTFVWLPATTHTP